MSRRAPCRCPGWALVLAMVAPAPGRVVRAQARPATENVGRQNSVPANPDTVVAGQVVSAADGHPIPNATLTLSLQPQRNRRREDPPVNPGQTATTDAEGRYRFPPQSPGRYHLRASAPGYLGALYLEHAGFSSAVVTGAGVPTDSLRFALVPEASLHGRVIDDTGEPVRAMLMLFRDTAGDEVPALPAGGDAAAPPMRRAGGAQADDDGVFQFTGLRPGRYYLAATATPWYAVHVRPQQDEEHLPYRTSVDPALDVAYPLTFYPHSTSEDGAVPITLKPGQRATANLRMEAEHSVSLTVQLPGDGTREGGAPPFPNLVRSVFGLEQPVASQGFSRDGQTITVLGIAPGQYRMRSYGRQPLAGQGGETTVDLSGGSATVAMPRATSATPSEVVLEVQSAGDALPAGLEVELQRASGFRGAAPLAAPVQQGAAKFSGIDAGTYRLRLQQGEGSTWNVSRLMVGGKVVPSRQLRVGEGTLRAAVLLSSYAPELDGVVHALDGKAHPGSLVLLVPAGKDSGEDLYRRDQSDLDGGFQFLNVLPGNYLLVAIDNGWQLNWRNPAALMPYLQHATPVVVPPSGPRTIALHEAATAQAR